MVVVDSGVWIDFFNGVVNPASDELERLLAEGEVRIVVPDLVLFEVLRGFRHERDHRGARELLGALAVEAAVSPELALIGAQHYRHLRSVGVTVRSSIDVLVAGFCIERDYLLLHNDRDYAAFEDLRGLRCLRPMRH